MAEVSPISSNDQGTINLTSSSFNRGIRMGTARYVPQIAEKVRSVITVRTNLLPWTRVARAVDLEHSAYGRTVLQNSFDNLKPAIIAEACENERRVASAAHVLAAKPEFEVWKHTCVMEGDNPLGHKKLFPEYRRALELLKETASRLAWMLRGLTEKCGQEAHARQGGPADESKCARHNQKSTRNSQMRIL